MFLPLLILGGFFAIAFPVFVHKKTKNLEDKQRILYRSLGMTLVFGISFIVAPHAAVPVPMFVGVLVLTAFMFDAGSYDWFFANVFSVFLPPLVFFAIYYFSYKVVLRLKNNKN